MTIWLNSLSEEPTCNLMKWLQQLNKTENSFFSHTLKFAIKKFNVSQSNFLIVGKKKPRAFIGSPEHFTWKNTEQKTNWHIFLALMFKSNLHNLRDLKVHNSQKQVEAIL